jgi:hypothetical protein
MLIAKPCTVSWDAMKGDERVRFCHHCSLNVYNIEKMTASEAEALLGGARVCARLFRRADGTVLTSDCPMGLAALRRRVSRSAAAAFAALMSFASAAYGQGQSTGDQAKQIEHLPGESLLTVESRSPFPTPGAASFSVNITDSAGVAMPGAKISLRGGPKNRKFNAEADGSGHFQFPLLEPGTYTVSIRYKGFNKVVQPITLGGGELVRVLAVLAPESCTVTIGIVGFEPLIDTTKPGGTTVIQGDMIRRLPL